ncbi:integrase core domain-containing protein [Rhodobacter ferrooxidans]|uniref:Integrase catalytic region n=1 Tax=Rhodobacter ferrooxidans TaxID=371731 RepID=C8S436_9RHOB|nr:integrase core domain-containing protein [Rhodobacter sp. SW2]EEW24298.1 Integrase catalytic region [Rhodobacter sp. SW2]
MKPSRHTEAQVIAILRQTEGGVPVAELCREHGMSNASIYKWRAMYGGMDASLITQMKTIEVDFSLPAERVIRSFDRIIEWCGKPGTIRVDNSPEYISEKLMKWAEKHGVILLHIQSGQPQQNAYIERHNSTVRHEWLDQYIIETIKEDQDQATQWLWTYNNDRPKMGIGGITPARKLKMAA